MQNSNSYGAENAHCSDTCGPSEKFYWGGVTDTQSYALYFAIKKATPCVAPPVAPAIAAFAFEDSLPLAAAFSLVEEEDEWTPDPNEADLANEGKADNEDV